MKTGRPSLPRSGDILIYLTVLGLAALLFLFRILPQKQDLSLNVVIQTDETTVSFPLDTDRRIPVSGCGYSLEVVIENGAVSVLSADCPDRLCAAEPPVSRVGQSIICLPAHTVIRIAADRPTEHEGRDRDADIILG